MLVYATVIWDKPIYNNVVRCFIFSTILDFVCCCFYCCHDLLSKSQKIGFTLSHSNIQNISGLKYPYIITIWGMLGGIDELLQSWNVIHLHYIHLLTALKSDSEILILYSCYSIFCYFIPQLHYILLANIVYFTPIYLFHSFS